MRTVRSEVSDRMLIGEVWVPDAARLARYASPAELHTVFNFPYLGCPWDAAALRVVIDRTLASGGPPTWVRCWPVAGASAWPGGTPRRTRRCPVWT